MTMFDKLMAGETIVIGQRSDGTTYATELWRARHRHVKFMRNTPLRRPGGWLRALLGK